MLAPGTAGAAGSAGIAAFFYLASSSLFGEPKPLRFLPP